MGDGSFPHAKSPGWLAGRLAGQGANVVSTPAVAPTRKTRILDSCRSGGFQAGWLAGWLARSPRGWMEGWWMVDTGLLVVEEWVVDGGWWMENGEWRMENGEWRIGVWWIDAVS